MGNLINRSGESMAEPDDHDVLARIHWQVQPYKRIGTQISFVEKTKARYLL